MNQNQTTTTTSSFFTTFTNTGDDDTTSYGSVNLDASQSPENTEISMAKLPECIFLETQEAKKVDDNNKQKSKHSSCCVLI
ncbi:hypothetical protein L3V82_00365 [Thiotrichales bacterium 19S3-7]|nr:hypothetical protein [Thiotrichales bacterium 19S3-7]MCF6800616.1 hypothetical protein [Thiotrichales bacterium 19S3-11]